MCSVGPQSVRENGRGLGHSQDQEGRSRVQSVHPNATSSRARVSLPAGREGSAAQAGLWGRGTGARVHVPVSTGTIPGADVPPTDTHTWLPPKARRLREVNGSWKVTESDLSWACVRSRKPSTAIPPPGYLQSQESKAGFSSAPDFLCRNLRLTGPRSRGRTDALSAELTALGQPPFPSGGRCSHLGGGAGYICLPDGILAHLHYF